MILGALPIRIIEPREGNNPLQKLGLILKVHNPSPSAGILIPVATIEGCIKIASDRGPQSPDENLPLFETSALYRTAEMSLPPEERVTDSGAVAAARRHQHTVQCIFLSGNFRDTSSTNIGISAYGIEYIGVVFPLESTLPQSHEGVMGSVSLDGRCAEVKERNKNPTIFHIFANKPLRGFESTQVLRPEFSGGQLKILLQAGDRLVIVPPEVIKPLIDRISWKSWTDLLLQQMYEIPSTDNPPTKQPSST
jgi:hypothetical protein